MVQYSSFLTASLLLLVALANVGSGVHAADTESGGGSYLRRGRNLIFGLGGGSLPSTPSTLGASCSSNSDCDPSPLLGDGTYCASNGKCKANGTCVNDADCDATGNYWGSLISSLQYGATTNLCKRSTKECAQVCV